MLYLYFTLCTINVNTHLFRSPHTAIVPFTPALLAIVLLTIALLATVLLAIMLLIYKLVIYIC